MKSTRPFRNSGFVIPSTFLIRALSFALFVAQRHHRIDLHGAARGDVTGEQGSAAKKSNDPADGQKLLDAVAEVDKAFRATKA